MRNEIRRLLTVGVCPDRSEKRPSNSSSTLQMLAASDTSQNGATCCGKICRAFHRICSCLHFTYTEHSPQIAAAWQQRADLEEQA